MKELNSMEKEQVSGAGLFADLGGMLGGLIGGLIGGTVDSGTALGGLKTNAKAPATILGKGIGSIFELNVLGAVGQIGAGITGIVGAGIDAINQIFGKKPK